MHSYHSSLSITITITIIPNIAKTRLQNPSPGISTTVCVFHIIMSPSPSTHCTAWTQILKWIGSGCIGDDVTFNRNRIIDIEHLWWRGIIISLNILSRDYKYHYYRSISEVHNVKREKHRSWDSDLVILITHTHTHTSHIKRISSHWHDERARKPESMS